MKNVLKIDHEKNLLVMDRTFAKNAENTMSKEYAHLQRCRADYPTYTVVRKEIKKNTSKETYPGLTYDYMISYIITHTEPDERKVKLEEFNEMILLSKCHRAKYPAVKKWFLNEFPDVVRYGMPKDEKETKSADNNVIEINNSESVADVA